MDREVGSVEQSATRSMLIVRGAQRDNGGGVEEVWGVIARQARKLPRAAR